MEPITTAIAITGIVSYLGSQLKKNKSVNDFINEFTSESVKWIKPLFLKDDNSLQKEVQKLSEKPDSETKQNAVKAMLASELEDNPEAEKFIIDMYKKINKIDEGEKKVKIINQTHTGSGDNVGGDKYVGK